MKGKIAPIIFGSLALAGLLLAFVGFAMGGRPGAITLRDGQLVFLSSRDNVSLGAAPGWFGENWNWGLGYNLLAPGTESGNLPEAGEAKGEAVALPFADDAQLRGFDLDIEGGHVYVMMGDRAELRVDGPMPYKTEFENGVWEVKTTHNYRNLTWGAKVDGMRRILYNGQDVTTVFTIVLPRNMAHVELEVSVGDMRITDLRADTAELSIQAGHMEIDGGQVRSLALDTDAGSIVAVDLASELCEMDVDAGSIEYEGDVSTRLEADCDAGSIIVTVANPGEFGWETQTGAGSIVIDGEAYGSLFDNKTRGNEHVTPFYQLDCDAGSIEIIFY